MPVNPTPCTRGRLAPFFVHLCRTLIFLPQIQAWTILPDDSFSGKIQSSALETLSWPCLPMYPGGHFAWLLLLFLPYQQTKKILIIGVSWRTTTVLAVVYL